VVEEDQSPSPLPEEVDKEEQSPPPLEEVEAVSFPSFSVWSSSNEDSERNLEDNKDMLTENLEDFSRL
jgi:hypothetical protein